MTQEDLLRTLGDRLESRGAEPIDGDGGALQGHAGLEARMAGQVGSVGGGLQDVPEDDMIHVRGLDPGTGQRLLRGERSQVRGRQIFEGATEGAETGSDAGEEDDGGHWTWKYAPPPDPLQGIGGRARLRLRFPCRS